MAIPAGTHRVFHVQTEGPPGTYRIEISEPEVTVGGLTSRQAYRFAILSAAPSAAGRGPVVNRTRVTTAAPFDQGYTVEIEIEDISEQGDGSARIGPGISCLSANHPIYVGNLLIVYPVD